MAIHDPGLPLPFLEKAYQVLQRLAIHGILQKKIVAKGGSRAVGRVKNHGSVIQYSPYTGRNVLGIPPVYWVSTSMRVLLGTTYVEQSWGQIYGVCPCTASVLP